MPAFGYYVYLVRAAKPFNTGQLYRLNAAGDHGDDLLDAVHRQLKALGNGYQRQARSAEGYRVREKEVRGRTLWIRINRGPEGVPGETWDRDKNKGTDTTDRIVLMNGLRAMFAFPEDSYFGLLFVEKVGQRNLRELLHDMCVLPAGAVTGTHITLESFAEIADWKREIDALSAVRISESLEVRATGDDASTKDDTVVHITAAGGQVRRATERVREIFLDRVGRRDERLEVLARTSELGERRRQAEADGVTFQEETEYQADLKLLQSLNRKDESEPELAEVISQFVPVDRETASHKRFSVDMGDDMDRTQRVIAIEGSSIPQFKYELGSRLTDSGLRDTWIAHAEGILRRRMVTLPADWTQKKKSGGGGKAS